MFDQKRNRLLEICVVISLVVHTGFLAFLQNQCFWFYPSEQRALASQVEKFSADQILKEAFEPTSEKDGKILPQKEVITASFAESSLPFKEAPPLAHSLPSVSFDEMLASHTTLLPIHFSLPSLEYLDLVRHLPKDLILPTAQRPKSVPFFQPQSERSEEPIAQLYTPSLLSPPENAYVPPKNGGVELAMQVKRAHPTIPVPSLPRLPTLAELQTVNLSDSFESELTFLPKEDGSGYIFALTLIPRAELKLPKLKQNIVFLIDRSNSIQKERLQSTKLAVRKAIEELDGQDRFNIIVFDQKLDKAFPTLLNSTPEAKERASRFLDEISLGSLFTLGDLYKPLFLTIPSFVPEDELYTAILFSDGEALSKKPSHRAFFRDWTLQNNSRVSLYSVSLTHDQNLSTIDAVCAFNHGKLFTSTTNKGLKRKSQRLMKDIRNPIAKNIVVKTIPKNGDTSIQISSLAPTLYLDQPYTIMGSVETLDDCILFLQGRVKDRFVNIRKTLSFVHGKKGGNALSEGWAVEQAYKHYERYIFDEDPKHLVEAQAILEPFNLPAIK